MTNESLYQSIPRNPKAQLHELEPPRVSPVSNGEHDQFTHMVDLTTGRVPNDDSATSLCGKNWVPEGMGIHYPICPTCHEMAERANLERAKAILAY